MPNNTTSSLPVHHHHTEPKPQLHSDDHTIVVYMQWELLGSSSEADPSWGFWGLKPLFSSGSGTFLIEIVVLSESDESEYVISNVLSNVLALNYLSFKVNGSSCVLEHTRHVSHNQLAAPVQFSFAAGSRSVNSMIPALFKR